MRSAIAVALRRSSEDALEREARIVGEALGRERRLLRPPGPLERSSFHEFGKPSLSGVSADAVPFRGLLDREGKARSKGMSDE